MNEKRISLKFTCRDSIQNLNNDLIQWCQLEFYDEMMRSLEIEITFYTVQVQMTVFKLVTHTDDQGIPCTVRNFWLSVTSINLQSLFEIYTVINTGNEYYWNDSHCFLTWCFSTSTLWAYNIYIYIYITWHWSGKNNQDWKFL